MALQPVAEGRIDRSRTTPFLVRVFHRERTFHSPTEFATVPPSPALTRHSVDLYAWPDTTLSELTSLMYTARTPSAADLPHSIGTRIGFRLVHPDTRSISRPGDPGRWLSKPLGTLVVGADMMDDREDTNGNGHIADESNKTLADARYVIGDYISAVFIPPLADGRVAPLPPSEKAGGPVRHMNGHGGRGGGYGREVDRAYGRGPSSTVPRGEWARGEALPDERDSRAARQDRYR